MVTRQGSVPVSLAAPLVVAASTTLMCAAIWVGDPTTPNGPLPVCPTKALLGIDCPGCGSARMLYSLMHGNLVAAARFNALGLGGGGAVGVGVPGVDLRPRDGPTDPELATPSLVCGGDTVVGGGLVCGAQHPGCAIQRALCLIP